MSNEEQQNRGQKGAQRAGERRDPAGFTSRSGGLTSEYAREQGWDMNEQERTKAPNDKQEYDGGRDYDYGARDFGDTAVDTSSADPEQFGITPDAFKSSVRQSMEEGTSENGNAGFSEPDAEDI